MVSNISLFIYIYYIFISHAVVTTYCGINVVYIITLHTLYTLKCTLLNIALKIVIEFWISHYWISEQWWFAVPTYSIKMRLCGAF